MDHVMVAVAIAMGLAFTTGVIMGIVAMMIAAAVRREDRHYTLTRPPPDHGQVPR